jgi:hypothetical protein
MPSCRTLFDRNYLWLVALLAALVFAAPMMSQSFYGSIVGTVTDQSGATITGATVTLVNIATSETRTTQLDESGSYRFVNLVPGTYRVAIEQPGFRRYTRDQIQVNVEAAVRVDVGLEVGDVNQSVEVTAAAPLLQTENTSLSQVVQSRSVQELPLNGRNVLNLVQIVPGVVPQGSSDGSLTGKNVFAGGNFQIGGGTANQSAAYYDGVPMNDTYGNIVAIIPSQDAVSEFRVQTNSNSAEFGRYTGGVINIASRSGSNDFHGTLYEFHRNKVLNASNFFANATGAGKPPFVQNQFGGTVGGPVVKDKIFFFAGYEGFRQRQGNLFRLTVPTADMLRGDFSNYRNAAGDVIPIYDPLTQCGAHGNAACPAGVTDQRTPFPNNIIPANRINPIARRLADFPIWGAPTGPGDPFTQNFNFARNASTGGDNDQLNFRGDFNISDKQRLLARYTRWKSSNLPVDVYGNGQRNGDPFSPESFTTDHAVLADTYTLSSTSILDVRAGFMRWYYNRTPGNLGIDLVDQFGFPSYYNQLEAIDGVTPLNTIPGIGATGYNFISTGLLAARDNTYTLTPTLTQIIGRHTLKFGGELRRADINYFQNNNPTGSFQFTNVFTSRNALNPGATGSPIASFLLGYPATANTQTSPFTAGSIRYQGYFINDTFQVNRKLTLNLGVRWEIPGVYTERFDRLATFNRDIINPALEGTLVNGQPVRGAFVLVGTELHPERSMRPEKYGLFAPRVGIAYRLTDSTVLRVGGGIYYIPSNVKFEEGPYGNAVNQIINNMVTSIDNQVTPAATLSNPYPNGVAGPPGRDPSFQRTLLGGSARVVQRDIDWGYTGQWNFTLQHQFPGDIALEAAYAGLRGLHLPLGDLQMNQIDPAYFSQGTALRDQVPNPFFGQIQVGDLSQRTVQRGQLLLPFPQYSGFNDAGVYRGSSHYHALQMKAEKRFGAGGMVLASYTFSKITTNAETLTSWLDNAQGVARYQNVYDLKNEWALSSFDSRNRLVLSYVLDLPFGTGKRFMSGSGGVANRLVSGWGFNGTSTFQDGFPMGFTATPNLTGFNTGLRPNVDANCEKEIPGSAQSRLNRWFNTSCFSVPGAFTFGNESRTDPDLRGHGIANFNFAIFKKTPITETSNLEFRAEAFNLFNRVQFGKPDQVLNTAANTTFGRVTTQANDPRLIQLALRFTF